MKRQPFHFSIINGTPHQLSRAVLELPCDGDIFLRTPPDNQRIIAPDDLPSVFSPGNEAWQLCYRPESSEPIRFRCRDTHTIDEIHEFVAGTVSTDGWTVFLWGDGGVGNLCYGLTSRSPEFIRGLEPSLVSNTYHIVGPHLLATCQGLLFGGEAPGGALESAVQQGVLPLVICDRFGEYVDSLWPHNLAKELLNLGELSRGEGGLAVYVPESWPALRQMCEFAIERQRELIALPGSLSVTDVVAVAEQVANQQWCEDVKLANQVEWIFAAARGGGEVANQYFVSTDCGLRRRVCDNLPGHKLIACF